MGKTNSLKILFSNKPGTIIRIALVLERRGYQIEALQIFPLEGGNSAMDLVVKGEQAKFEQIRKQLAKLIDVISVTEVDERGERVSLAAEEQVFTPLTA